MKKHVLLLLILGPLMAFSTATPGETAWQQEWNQVLEAGKKEGMVAVSGPAGVPARNALIKPFEDKFGIKVVFFGASGRALTPRILTERRAGQYSWDVFVHGTGSAVRSMIPSGAFAPLKPALILPEVTDADKWRGGGLEVMGPNGELAVMTPFQRGTLYYNTKLVDPKQFKSYKDLLDPKWKGKVAVDDPTRGGPGQATFTFFYLHPDLGPEFIRALAKQNLILQRDYTTEADDLGHARFPLVIGAADFLVEYKMKQGLPIGIVSPLQLKEGSDVSPANGATALYKNAPHPNAAKVYLNWLLSKEAQTIFARNMGYPSARLDVPTDHVEPWRVPQPGAIKSYDKRAFSVKKDVVVLVKQVFRN